MKHTKPNKGISVPPTMNCEEPICGHFHFYILLNASKNVNTITAAELEFDSCIGTLVFARLSGLAQWAHQPPCCACAQQSLFCLLSVCLHLHFIMQTCKSSIFTIKLNYLTREDKEIFCLVFIHNYFEWLKRIGERRNLQSNSNKNTYHTNKEHAISYIFFWRHWLTWYCLIANLTLWVTSTNKTSMKKSMYDCNNNEVTIHKVAIIIDKDWHFQVSWEDRRFIVFRWENDQFM